MSSMAHYRRAESWARIAASRYDAEVEAGTATARDAAAIGLLHVDLAGLADLLGISTPPVDVELPDPAPETYMGRLGEGMVLRHRHTDGLVTVGPPRLSADGSPGWDLLEGGKWRGWAADETLREDYTPVDIGGGEPR